MQATMQPKPGYLTTEWWITVVTTAWAFFGHSLPSWEQALVATVVPATYQIGRAVVKASADRAAAAQATAAAATPGPSPPSAANPYGGG
jgi:hypothetical protein